MKKVIYMLLSAMLLMGVCAAAQGEATITVQGSGSVTAVPDIVTITVNASVMGATMYDAQVQVSTIVESATTMLLELGLQEADIVTTNYGYNPQYRYEEDARLLVGYQASHTMEITCRDIGLLDSVIGAVTDSGMTDIYNISYDVADRSALYRQAVELAVASAAEKAHVMAAAGGLTLGALESLTENQSYDARYAVTAMAAKDAAGINTGIRAGGVSVSASVTAVYRMQ